MTPPPGASPGAAYQAALASGRIEPDPAQSAVVAELDRLWRALSAAPGSRPVAGSPGGLGRLLRGLTRPKSPVSASPASASPAAPAIDGLYLWGGVGRGKTWLMDLLFAALPFPDKLRLHFHAFMEQVHARLAAVQGRADPLAAVAAGFAAEARVLCLDEMQVNDITDAMLMAGLLEALFARGVVLVTTANVPPAGLYRAGLQRQRFLPAIGLLERQCRVLELASPTDYRLQQRRNAPVYLVPPGRAADTQLARWFSDLSGISLSGLAGPPGPLPAGPLPGPPAVETAAIRLHGREVPVVAASAGVVWFDFDVICHIPRSKLDYLAVARAYPTVLVSNLRRLGDEQANLAQRLITLVDAVYDRNCALILSAEAPPAGLYQGRELAFEFQRTVSRLLEMQGEAWLAREHLG